MIGYFALIIFFALAYLREAKHDRLISTFPQDADQNTEWHTLDWQYLALTGIGISIFGAGYELDMTWRVFGDRTLYAFNIGMTIALLKVLVFNTRINKLLGNDWNYVGRHGLESKFKGKETWYYGIALLFLLINIFLITIRYVQFS
jgi:hypothetical protein